jgi:hypothetical protein
MVTAVLESLRCPLRERLTAVRGTLICALIVVLTDVVLDGSYLFSALVCPIWFLVSVVRAVARRPSPGVAAARVLIPVITLLFVVANYSAQGKIAMANAARVIQACEAYREAKGAYPERLSDLVPCFLNSIPRAKYCCQYGEFRYVVSPQHHTLCWYQVPPFGTRTYTLEVGAWHYLD